MYHVLCWLVASVIFGVIAMSGAAAMDRFIPRVVDRAFSLFGKYIGQVGAKTVLGMWVGRISISALVGYALSFRGLRLAALHGFWFALSFLALVFVSLCLTAVLDWMLEHSRRRLHGGYEEPPLPE